jgi:photosystem II stability/assembly factor-like uncharacterized protein
LCASVSSVDNLRDGLGWRRCVAALAIGGLAIAGRAAGEPWRSVGPEGGTVTLVRFAAQDHRVVYAVTGASNFFYGFPPVNPAIPGRVFRSADSGDTWNPASQGLPPVPILSLAIDPVRPQVAYVGNTEGLWKTTNSGWFWSPVHGPLSGQAVTALAIAPDNPLTIYAGTDYSGAVGPGEFVSGRIYRSDDGGRRWVASDRGLTDLTGPTTVAALAVLRAAPDSVVAILNQGRPGGERPDQFEGCGDIWKSTDGGRRWHGAGGFSSVCANSWGIQEDPTSHTLYISGDGYNGGALLSSPDLGESWGAPYNSYEYGPSAVVVNPTGRLYGIVATGGSSPFFPSTVIGSSADGGLTWQEAGRAPWPVQLLAVDPSVPGQLLAGAVRGGLLRTENRGRSWSAASRGLVASVITAINSQPSGALYVGTYEGGVLATTDGKHWQSVGPASSTDVNPEQVDALSVHGSALWASVDGVPERSTDGGAIWLPLAEVDCADIIELAPDPNGSSIYAIPVYFRDICGSQCALLESRDGGLDWTCQLQQFFYWASGVSIDPADPAIVYGLFSTNGATAQVWKSSDRGMDFQRSSVGLGQSDITTLANSTVDHNVLWAAGEPRGVFKSVDQAAHWTRVDRDLPQGRVLALVADPRDPASAYLEIEGAGVFRTVNGGARWRPIPGLPTDLLDGTLAVGDTDGQRNLYAGTAGAGLFALPIP